MSTFAIDTEPWIRPVDAERVPTIFTGLIERCTMIETVHMPSLVHVDRWIFTWSTSATRYTTHARRQGLRETGKGREGRETIEVLNHPIPW